MTAVAVTLCAETQYAFNRPVAVRIFASDDPTDNFAVIDLTGTDEG